MATRDRARPRLDAAAEALKQAGERGLTYAELARAMGVTKRSASQLGHRLRDLGLAVISLSRGEAPVTIWWRELAPHGAESRVNTVVRPIKRVCSGKPAGAKKQPALTGEAKTTDRTRHTVAPKFVDVRFCVRKLPDDYVSQLDPNDCRDWAKAVTR